MTPAPLTMSVRSFLRSTVYGATLAGACLMALAGAPQAHAQASRSFPETAAIGQLSMGVFPEATLDKQAVVLGPGTRILDENNRLVLPASLNQPRTIAYTRGALGEIQRIWLLTPAEHQALRNQIAQRQRALRELSP